MVAAFCCGAVYGVSLAALHQAPHDQDGRVVALRDSPDS